MTAIVDGLKAVVANVYTTGRNVATGCINRVGEQGIKVPFIACVLSASAAKFAPTFRMDPTHNAALSGVAYLVKYVADEIITKNIKINLHPNLRQGIAVLSWITGTLACKKLFQLKGPMYYATTAACLSVLGGQKVAQYLNA